MGSAIRLVFYSKCEFQRLNPKIDLEKVEKGMQP